MFLTANKFDNSFTRDLFSKCLKNFASSLSVESRSFSRLTLAAKFVQIYHKGKMFFSFLNSHPIHSNYVNLMSYFAGRHFTKHIWEVKLVIYHPTESNS